MNVLNSKEYSFNIDSVNEVEIIDTLIEQMLSDTSISIRKCFDDYLSSIYSKDIDYTYGVLGADRSPIEKYFYMKFILYKNIDSILFNTLKIYIYKFSDKSKFINLKEDLIEYIIKSESTFFYSNSIESKLKSIYKKFEYHTNVIANSRLDDLKNMLDPYKKTVDYYVKCNRYEDMAENTAKCFKQVFDMVYSSIDILQKRGNAPNIEDILKLLDSTNKIYLYDFLNNSLIKEINFISYKVTLRDIELIIQNDIEETISLSKVCKIKENNIYIYVL